MDTELRRDGEKADRLSLILQPSKTDDQETG